VTDFEDSVFYLKNLTRHCKVILLSAVIDEGLLQLANNIGAIGIIPLTCDCEIISLATKRLMQGRSSWASIKNATALLPPRRLSLFTKLTNAQYRVVELVAQGMFNKQIADELEISECTVKVHVTKVLKSGNLRSRTELAAKWLSRKESAPSRRPPSLFATLTSAQYRIVVLVAQGMFNKQIADELKISESTVKVHISNVLKRTNLRSRTELAVNWLSREESARPFLCTQQQSSVA